MLYRRGNRIIRTGLPEAAVRALRAWGNAGGGDSGRASSSREPVELRPGNAMAPWSIPMGSPHYERERHIGSGYVGPWRESRTYARQLAGLKWHWAVRIDFFPWE